MINDSGSDFFSRNFSKLIQSMVFLKSQMTTIELNIRIVFFLGGGAGGWVGMSRDNKIENLVKK